MKNTWLIEPAYQAACWSALCYKRDGESYARWIQRVTRFGLEMRVDECHAAEIEDEAIILTRKGNLASLWIRGTDHRRNWFSNMRYDQVRTCFGACHYGFNRGWAPILDYVNARINRDIVSRFEIGGHSRGAGLAIRGFPDMCCVAEPHACHAFEPPRVWAPKDAKDFDRKWRQQVYTYTFSADIVPRTPPKWAWSWRTGMNFYKHVGMQVHGSMNGSLIVNPASYQVRLDRLHAKLRILGGRGLPVLWEAHGMEHWTKALYRPGFLQSVELAEDAGT